MGIISTITKFMPRFIVCGLRGAYILVSKRGQTKRDQDGNCVDAEGKSLPWLTYPIIDYLNNLDLSTYRVFEYGSGSSTLFWAERCTSVASVEHFSPWFERMDKYNSEHIRIVFEPNLNNYPKVIENKGLFDIILIDGAARMACAKESVNHVKPTGFIILDNCEWYPNIATFLRNEDFLQIDFCGFTPLNSFTSMTSLFFRESLKVSYKAKAHNWSPIGGKILDNIPSDD
jgi:hypothetical protein